MSTGPAQAVLFDWDGTLIDSGGLLLRCWHHVTSRVLGAPFPVTEQDRVKFLSMRGVDSFPLLSDDPNVVRALEDGFTEAYRELAPTEVREHEGARQMLEQLRAQGLKVGVVTSKTRARMSCDLEACDFDGCFDVVVTGDDVARGKPDPEGIRAGLAALGVPAAQAVMVGDGPVDIRAGQAAGTRTVGVSHGLHSLAELEAVAPDYLVSSLGELGALLRVR